MVGLVITSEDLRYLQRNPAGRRYCVDGARGWLESHGFSMREFLRHGISAEALEATGDALALDLVSRIKKERRHGGE